MEPEQGSPSGALLRALFDEVLALPEAEREDFLARRSAGNPTLHGKLQELLRHESALGSFLERPLADPARPRSAPKAVCMLEPGARIGDFEIESFLARGGGGQVFRARQLSLGGRLVALKVSVLAGLEAGDRERFLRGTRIAAETHHPALVEVYASGEDAEQGLIYCSMRLVEGHPLQEVLGSLARAGRRPERALRRELVERFVEVTGALAALHERGAVHRDVKPANIMIEGGSEERPSTGRAVLVDFGLLRTLGGETNSTLLGTLPYLAPEALLEGRVDARADVYALGLCMYDLFSGRSPVERAGAAAEIRRLSRIVTDLEPELEAIVHRAIEPHPRHRYADAGAMGEDLARWLAGKAVRARRLRGLEALRRKLRHHPDRVLRESLRTGTLAIVLTAAIGAAYFASELRGRARQARAAFESGDLIEFEHAAALVPRRLQGLLLGGPMLPTLDALRTPEDPLAAVVATGLREDEDAALLLAARYLGRDGLGTHPSLARFLLHALDSGEHSSSAIRLCSRLFIDRPAESALEQLQDEPFRVRLTRVLTDPGSSDLDRLFTLSALGGCGGPSTPGEIHAWLGERSDGPQLFEELRLAMRASEWIGRRSHEAGFRRELASQDWDAMLATFTRILRIVQSRPNPDFGALPALQEVASTAALIRSVERLEPLAFDPNPFPEFEIVFRAANRDPLLLRAPELVLEGLLQPGSHFSARCLAAGRALGLLGRPLSTERILGCLVRLELPAALIPDFWANLDFGFAAAAGDMQGFPTWLRPDANTRLGAWFEETARAWVTLAPPARAPVAPITESRTLALWDFMGEAPRLSGRATRLDSLSVEFLDDGLPHSGFACLGVDARSELRFSFRLDEGASAKRLLFRFNYQKGVRPWLPFSGEASMVVSFENQEQTVTAGDENSRDGELSLSPRRISPDGEYVVSIRLKRASTTTLRVYRAEIRLPEE